MSHKYYSMSRKSRSSFIFISLTIGVILSIYFWGILTLSISPEYSPLTPLVILLVDYTLKFIFGHSHVKVIPYWTLPFSKKSILHSLLFLEIISPWTLCSVLTLIYFLTRQLFIENNLNTQSTLFLFSCVILIILNSYYTLFIRTLQSNFSYLLHLLFLVMSIFLYLLLLLSDYFVILITLVLIFFAVINYKLIKETIYKHFDLLNL